MTAKDSSFPIAEHDWQSQNYVDEIVGGVALHMKPLKAAGFVQVDCTWQQTPAAIIAAHSHM